MKQNIKAVCSATPIISERGILRFPRRRTLPFDDSYNVFATTSTPRIPQNSTSGHVIGKAPRSQNH